MEPHFTHLQWISGGTLREKLHRFKPVQSIMLSFKQYCRNHVVFAVTSGKRKYHQIKVIVIQLFCI